MDRWQITYIPLKMHYFSLSNNYWNGLWLTRDVNRLTQIRKRINSANIFFLRLFIHWIPTDFNCNFMCLSVPWSTIPLLYQISLSECVLLTTCLFGHRIAMLMLSPNRHRFCVRYKHSIYIFTRAHHIMAKSVKLIQFSCTSQVDWPINYVWARESTCDSHTKFAIRKSLAFKWFSACL